MFSLCAVRVGDIEEYSAFIFVLGVTSFRGDPWHRLVPLSSKPKIYDKVFKQFFLLSAEI